MSAAPTGQKKAAEENVPSTDVPDANKTETQAPDSAKVDHSDGSEHDTAGNKAAPSEAKGKAPAETVSKPRAKRAATTTANPESTSKPGDESAPAESDSSTPSGAERQDNDPAKEGPAVFDVAPSIPGPNDAVVEGAVQITRKAREGENSDPAGNVTELNEGAAKGAPKSDSFVGIEGSNLPVSATVGQVIGTIEEYAGRAVLSLSLVGWVGDAPFKILAKDTFELEGVLDALRSAVK